MGDVRDFGYMGKDMYSPYYYNDLIKRANANDEVSKNFYPSIFGKWKEKFSGDTAYDQWQDYIYRHTKKINEIGKRYVKDPKLGQSNGGLGVSQTKPNSDIKDGFKTQNDYKGFINPNLASHLATSGTGALIGAGVDDENRLRGALIGATAGFGGNKFIQMGAKAFFKNQTDNLAQNLPNIAKGNPKLFNQIADRSLQGAYKSEQKGMREGFIADESGVK